MMTNFKEIFFQSKLFNKVYFKQYFMTLKKPIIIGLIGALSLLLCFFGPIGALFSLFISIPCLCYAFWQGYLITYSLIFAIDAYSFNDKPSLIDCFKMAKIKGNQLALFLLFSMALSLILMLPMVVCLVFCIDLTTLQIKPCFYFIAFINSALLFPFSNFLNQAFFYKRDDEKFMDLFLNCYKKLDKNGVILSLAFSLIPVILSGVCPFCYLIIALLLNPFIYFMNTIWYKNRN